MPLPEQKSATTSPALARAKRESRILSEVNAAGAEAGVFNGLEPGERYALINEMLTPYAENMFVTPKEVDAVIDRLALIISTALNMALHPGLDRKDIELFV